MNDRYTFINRLPIKNKDVEIRKTRNYFNSKFDQVKVRPLKRKIPEAQKASSTWHLSHFTVCNLANHQRRYPHLYMGSLTFVYFHFKSFLTIAIILYMWRCTIIPLISLFLFCVVNPFCCFLFQPRECINDSI